MAEYAVLDLYPDDGGLKPQVRPFEDTLSAFGVLADHFGVLKMSDVIDLRVDLAAFAGMSRKESPTPWDQGLYDRLVRNLLRCGPALLAAATAPKTRTQFESCYREVLKDRDAAVATLAQIRDILSH